MRLDGLKILVTGGMGYIGSHTCKALVSAGANVISVDNRVVEQNRLAGVKYITADYADEKTLTHLRWVDKVDGIVHCAGTSLVGPSVQNPSEYYNNNVVKTIQMLDHLKTWNNKPFVVFSSSAATYGNAENCAIMIQETDPTVPCNPYGNTKEMIERILHDYDVAYGIKHYCFRYFNAAGADVWDSDLGPEPNDTHIIPRIFEAYAKGGIFRLFGTDYSTDDGTCVRDYIHVCDLALAHLRACVSLSEGSESFTYNLGTNTGYSNKQIIDAFKEYVGDVEVLEEDRRPGDPDSLVADATKFNEIQSPKFSDLKTIMISFKEYYEKHQ